MGRTFFRGTGILRTENRDRRPKRWILSRPENFWLSCGGRREIPRSSWGEKLGVSNKTVSRWETGAYLPPVEMLQAISGLYGVSINELLAGGRLEGADYQAAAEENLRQVMEQSAFSLEERKTYYKKNSK